MKLQAILRQLIKAKAMTIAGLSKKTKVPAQTIHNWLSGVEPKSLNQIKAVADFFGVTVDYLCFGIEETPKNECDPLKYHSDEINAGVFEVVLRRVRR